MTQLEPGGETADVTLPSINNGPGRVQLRMVLLGLTLIGTFFGIVGLALYLKPFGDSPPSGEPSLDVFAAGPVKEFAPGSVTYFQKEHAYLIHFTDGAFLALYDLSPSTQAKVEGNDLTKLACRAVLTEGDAVAPHLGSDIAARGFATIGFVDLCSGAVWDAEGRHVGGASDGRLDRFPVAVINDIIRIDLGDRWCQTNGPASNPCIPTQ